jgi:hypothetical protein
MNFVMMRDRTIASVHGHAVEFKKGVATHVPPVMYDEVMAAGAVPEEELPEEEPKANDAEPTDPSERKALVMAAIEQIALKNSREDFTASGAPHGKALAAVLGFRVDNKERDLLWAEFQKKGQE